MDEKRTSRLIGKMTAIMLFAKRNKVEFTPLDDPNVTLSHVVRLIARRNLYIDNDVKCVDLIYPSAYKMKPLKVLLSDDQINDIRKIDNRIIIEKG